MVLAPKWGFGMCHWVMYVSLLLNSIVAYFFPASDLIVIPYLYSPLVNFVCSSLSPNVTLQRFTTIHTAPVSIFLCSSSSSAIIAASVISTLSCRFTNTLMPPIFP